MRLQSSLRSICGVCLFVSLSCVSQPEGLLVAGGGKPPVLHPVYGEPIVLASAQDILIPFWTYNPESKTEMQSFSVSGGFSSFSYSGSSGAGLSMNKAFGDYLSASAVHWNNLVFCNKGTGACHLLLDRKAVICSAYLPDPAAKDKSDAPKSLLFGIAERDTNGDGYINSDDAVLLYAAGLDGKGLTRLTPENTQLAGIVADGNDTIYVRVLRDSNADHRFTNENEAVILRVDLRHPAEGQRVLDEELAKRAKAIIEGK
jgi:hypothetical protein